MDLFLIIDSIFVGDRIKLFYYLKSNYKACDFVVFLLWLRWWIIISFFWSLFLFFFLADLLTYLLLIYEDDSVWTIVGSLLLWIVLKLDLLHLEWGEVFIFHFIIWLFRGFLIRLMSGPFEVSSFGGHVFFGGRRSRWLWAGSRQSWCRRWFCRRAATRACDGWCPWPGGSCCPCPRTPCRVSPVSQGCARTARCWSSPSTGSPWTPRTCPSLRPRPCWATRSARTRNGPSSPGSSSSTYPPQFYYLPFQKN